MIFVRMWFQQERMGVPRDNYLDEVIGDWLDVTFFCGKSYVIDIKFLGILNVDLMIEIL